MFRNRPLLAVVTIGALCAFGAEANAQSARPAPTRGVQSHFDEQATKLLGQVRELTGQLREQARGSDYRRLYRESTELFYLADHVHEMTHGPLDLEHLEEDLKELDRVFHRMEDLAEDLGDGPHRGRDAHDDHGHGTNEIVANLHEIEDTLHHLVEDAEKLRRRPVRTAAPPQQRRGVTFGNGRFRVEFDD